MSDESAVAVSENGGPVEKQENRLTRAERFTELGSTGLKRQRGVVMEEWHRNLLGHRWRRTVREMIDNDPIVGAVNFATQMLLRQVEWRVEPGGTSPQDEEAAEFLESCVGDMSTSWDNTISEHVSFIPWGWNYSEIVYKQRQGANRDPGKRSRFNDGRIGWRKIPIRAQESLLSWKFDDEGGIQAMVQQDPSNYQIHTIPIEKALLFRTTTAKGNPEGRSTIRNAYTSYFRKKNVEFAESVGIERDLAGYPVMYVPPEWMDPNAPPEQKKALTEAQNMVRDIRRDDQEGAVLGAMYDAENNQTMKLELLSTQGRRQFDTNLTIVRLDQRIAMTSLADFILLGHEKVGSFALASSKTDLFAVALGAWNQEIASVYNRHAIPRLFALNDFRVDRLPQLVPGDIEVVDLNELAVLIQALAGAGYPLFPDEDLEAGIRTTLADRIGVPATAAG